MPNVSQTQTLNLLNQIIEPTGNLTNGKLLNYQIQNPTIIIICIIRINP